MYSKSRHTAETSTFEDLAKSPLMVCGNVENSIEKLATVTRDFGFNELLCWTRIGGMENKKVLRSMELMSGRVMPAVRKLVDAA
jgi:hypothetical protein